MVMGIGMGTMGEDFHKLGLEGEWEGLEAIICLHHRHVHLEADEVKVSPGSHCMVYLGST